MRQNIRHHGLTLSVSDHIEPEYRLSIKENFTAFTKAMYLGIIDLSSLIDMKVASPDRHVVPSWVLDLHAPPGSHLPLSKEEAPYCASAESLPAVEFVENDSVMSKGFHIDSVDGLTSTLWDEDSQYDQSAHHNTSYGSGGIIVREALWRTMVAERDDSGAVADRTSENVLDIPWAAFDSSTYDVLMLCESFEGFRMRNKHFRICGQDLSAFPRSVGWNSEQSYLASNT